MIIEPIEISLSRNSYKYYESLGYDIKRKIGSHKDLIIDLPQNIYVKFSDIPSYSKRPITIKCDICGKEFQRLVSVERKALELSTVDTCNECRSQKTNNTKLLRYGTTNTCEICKQTGTIITPINKYNIDSLKKLAESKNYFLREDLSDLSTINVLNKYTFECKKHNCIFESTILSLETSINSCPKCKCDEKSKRLSHSSIEQVKEICIQKNYELLTDYINTVDDKVQIICNKHRFAGIQNTSLYKLRYYKTNCKYCKAQSGENHWNWSGGISNIKEYFRNVIQPWKVDSFKKYDYCCDITGVNNDVVIHHLHNFADIVNEIFTECNLDMKQQVSDYTDSEIKMLEEKCLELHYKYGLGVCLSENVHKKFHSIYGNVNNTSEQYNEFKANVLNGSIII